MAKKRTERIGRNTPPTKKQRERIYRVCLEVCKLPTLWPRSHVGKQGTTMHVICVPTGYMWRRIKWVTYVKITLPGHWILHGFDWFIRVFYQFLFNQYLHILINHYMVYVGQNIFFYCTYLLQWNINASYSVMDRLLIISITQ